MVFTYAKAAQLGLVAGMRSCLAPALVSRQLVRLRPDSITNSPLRPLTAAPTANVLTALAVLELAGDKYPNVPDRVTAQPLLFRAVSGAVCGAAITQTNKAGQAAGAVLGGLGALGGAFLFFRLRQWLTHGQGLPDLAVALAEDALALGLGRQATRHLRP